MSPVSVVVIGLGGVVKRAKAIRIRKLFLEQREQYSLREAAALVGWSSRDMAREIASSELRRVDLDAHVSWRAVAMIAMTVWSYESIEEALGENALVLPPLARLADRTVRLPQFQLAAIEETARRQGITFNEFLAGHLTDLVCIEAPTLAKSIPGFREAFLWPQSQQRQ